MTNDERSNPDKINTSRKNRIAKGRDGRGTRDQPDGCTGLIVESLLGLRLEDDKLHFEPCLPADWAGFMVHYRYRETIYHIKVVQGHAGEDEASVTVDGVVQREQMIPLVDDHSEHFVEVVVMPIRLISV